MKGSTTCSAVVAVFLAGGIPAQDPNQQIRDLRQQLEQMQTETDEALEELENRLGQVQAQASKGGL